MPLRKPNQLIEAKKIVPMKRQPGKPLKKEKNIDPKVASIMQKHARRLVVRASSSAGKNNLPEEDKKEPK